MKLTNWTMIIVLFLVLSFMFGMTFLGSKSSEQRHRQEIECIQNGGTTDTFTKTCTKN